MTKTIFKLLFLFAIISFSASFRVMNDWDTIHDDQTHQEDSQVVNTDQTDHQNSDLDHFQHADNVAADGADALDKLTSSLPTGDLYPNLVHSEGSDIPWGQSNDQAQHDQTWDEHIDTDDEDNDNN